MAARRATARRPDRPHRRCLVSGTVRPKETLLRFALTATGGVVPDAAERLGGRGLWLSPGRDMIETALTRKLFAKAARRRIEAAADDLALRAEADLVRCWRDILGLARRAGQIAADGDEIATWMVSGKAGLLVETTDAGRRPESDPVWVTLADPDDLGRAIGRPDCGRAAVAVGNFAERLVIEAGRLAGFGRAAVGR